MRAAYHAAMRVGVQMVFQSYGYPPSVDDAQVYDEEIRLAELAERLGFHALWAVEHHFDDYSFCPDNTVLLANLAARTTRIKLGTGAVILPWNQPLRVAEKIALLDQLSGGRVLFGVGRGLSRQEYEGFGIPMDESRDRFDEAAPMIIEALETGWIEGPGPFFPQPRTPIRPAPTRSFRDRTYCVAMSPDSVVAAADLGARMIVFSQRPWPDQAAAYASYRERFVALHRAEPGPLLTCDFVYCDSDPGRAEDLARTHIAGYLASVLQHYELMSDHFKSAKGYENYGNAVDLMRGIGLEAMCDMYIDVQAWGTPDQIVDKLLARRDIIGDFELVCCFRYAGLPIEAAEASMRTFAAAVLPALRRAAEATTTAG
jgi:alkanesulfonate monooxygenase SsuD/methylene tetrahydromethanopterin reductase-like flavin-dependent oxidoreductase (luciferase family)